MVGFVRLALRHVRHVAAMERSARGAAAAGRITWAAPR
jgi:hypothetical protein